MSDNTEIKHLRTRTYDLISDACVSGTPDMRELETGFMQQIEGNWDLEGLGRQVASNQSARRLIDVRAHDLREWTEDKHRRVDDEPYGGGPGMVMKPEPFFAAR